MTDAPSPGDDVLLDSAGDPAPEPDAAARAQAEQRHAPPGPARPALGRLDELAVWLSGVRGTYPPPAAARVRVVVFAGDHDGAALDATGTSTAERVAAMLRGQAQVSVLAVPVDPALRGSDQQKALNVEETIHALAAGRALADGEIDSGADLLIVADLGAGNTIAASVLAALLTGAEPHTLVARESVTDDAAWIHRTKIIRDATRRGRPYLDQPGRLIGVVGSADLVAMAGFLSQAATRRTPVILDGSVSTAAALVADRLTPGARQWFLAGHRSPDPAHAAALRVLGLLPLLDLGISLGEGIGALLALPLVQAASALAGSANLEETGSGDQQPAI